MKLPSDPRFINITGKVFGRLTVISFAGYRCKNRVWRCRCRCGKESIVQACNLCYGHSHSCGCLAREITSKLKFVHGHAKRYSETWEYSSWKNAKDRTSRKDCRAYKYYGARGIKMCKRWFNSFVLFLQDMGPCPAGRSLGRINNDGDYKPSNCRWETDEQQCNNKRSTVWITVNGVRRTQRQWEIANGLTKGSVSRRIFDGWSKRRAVTTPIQKQR